MRRLLLIVVLCLLPLCGGCLLPGEGSRDLKVSPLSRPIEYEQTFDEAFAAPSSDGGYDLVMCLGYGSLSPADAQRVYPIATSRVSQVVHVHVSWRPARGVRSDFPAATNTTVDWYVLTAPASESPSFVHYSGIGYTAVELGETTSLFTFQGLNIHAREIVGRSADPLGESKLSGKIRATNDEPRVAAILQKLQQDIAAGTARPAEQPIPQPPGMPPARRQGP